jgi:hypothetical protein
LNPIGFHYFTLRLFHLLGDGIGCLQKTFGFIKKNEEAFFLKTSSKSFAF